MPLTHYFDRIPSDSTGADLLPEWIELAMDERDRSVFLQQLVESVIRQTRSYTTVRLIQGIKGTWRTHATAGTESNSPPHDLLVEVLDSERSQVRDGWAVAPVDRPNLQGLVLAVQAAQPDLHPEDVDSIAAACGIAQQVLAGRTKPLRQVERLQAMLEITAQWNQSRETDELLEAMAQTSTRLLDAERATIFLLDKNGQHLVGRPALGIETGSLTLPANAGVVGDVVQSGQSRRVDCDIAAEQDLIHREVDQQLGFETRSLLCVPIVNSTGQTIGAFELINKRQGNFTAEDEAALVELAAHSAVAIEKTQHLENLETTRRIAADEAADRVHLIGHAPKIVELRQTIERIAETDLVILITGENGTGKEVVAQMIHYLSHRRDEPLVSVNCAAITESLLESELFGHEKGAFTGAHETRPGKFERADQGTLFLDEIGDMSLGGQAKLLRVLEEKVVVRVGGTKPIPTSARIVAATNQNLAELVEQKKFRQDLFFRLNVVALELPPLRERGDDVIELAEYFLQQFCAKARRPVPRFTAAAWEKLRTHPWPGNVRELRNVIERLAYLSPGDQVDAENLSFTDAPKRPEPSIPLNLPLTDATRQFQIEYIQKHIDRAGGKMTDAARALGLHRSNLYRKMKQLGMSAAETDEE